LCSSYSLFICCFAVTLRTKEKVRFYRSSLKLCHARPRERKTPARQAAGTQASLVKGTFAAIRYLPGYPSNSQVLYTLGGGAENRHVIKLNSEFLRFDVFNQNEKSKTSARHAASKLIIKQSTCCNHNNEGNASSYTSNSQPL